MGETLALSLQAFPTVNKDEESLQYLIERINKQRGSFRNVTEKSLEEEIQETKHQEDEKSPQDVFEIVEDVEDVKSKKEAITTAREEILKQVVHAHLESSHALDFVSLLLSKYAPGPSQATVSHFLKQNLPLGTLGGEIVQAPQVLEIEKRNQELVSIGWRMQSLNNAADSLLKSASRLEEEIGKETKYWNSVLAVKDKGWSLSRLPREKHTLGIRYGFAEAYSDFRDRGLAALRREQDGSITLDRGFRSRGDRRIRVRLLHQGKPIASSVRVSETLFVDDSVEMEILNARNSIFDEELHHELHREARTLVNQGVRCIGSSILTPLETGKQLEIDLLSPEDTAPEDNIGSNPMVENAAIALRILLSHAHRQNLRLRSQNPPPVREAKPARRLYPILKPIVEFLQHRSYVQSIQAFLEEIRATMRQAGLLLAVETIGSPYNFTNVSAEAVSSGQFSTIDSLIQLFFSPIRTTIAIQSVDEQTVNNIDVNTSLSAPNLGTTFDVNKTFLPKSSKSTSLQPTQLSSLAALEDHIAYLITSSILQHLLSICSGWRTFAPHHSSIMRNRPGVRDREVVTLVLAKGQLSMTWQRTGSLNDQGMWTWECEGLQGATQTESLVEVFKQFQ